MTTISIRIAEPTVMNKSFGALGAFMSRVARGFQSTWCVVNGGHYKVLHTEPNRMALKCVACGHSSPGWTVGSPRLARPTPANPERLRARRQQAIA
jgi:hypothetical protein